MKEKGFAPIYLLVGILVIIGIAGGVFVYTNYSNNRSIFTPSKPPQPSSLPTVQEYEAVALIDLINNSKEYNDRKVLVKGKYTDFSGRVYPLCMPKGINDILIIKDTYALYPSTWGISDQNKELGVKVIDSGVDVSSLPNYSEGQEVTLKGIAKYTTVNPPCTPSNIKYKSIYLKVNAKDIDMIIKPIPSTLPSVHETVPIKKEPPLRSEP